MNAPKLVIPASEIEAAEVDFRHPLDDGCRCLMSPVSRLAGLAHGAVNLARIAPGETAFPPHRHQAEEEWAYVIEGNGEVLLDDAVHAIGPGDFVRFPAAGPTHAMRNTGPGQMTCLMGGNAPDADVIDFPDLGKRVARRGSSYEAAALDAFVEITLKLKDPA